MKWRIFGRFESKGKCVGKLGGLIVNRNGVQVQVGGGFSDVQLIEVEVHKLISNG